MQLTPIRQQKQFIHFLLGFIAVWGFAFLFVIALNCESSRPWELVGRRCFGYVSSPAQRHDFLIVY